MTDSIRVLIAEDHEVVRDGLRMILETEEGFNIVGEAADGVEAVKFTEEPHPDVVLMDLRIPRMDGLEAIEQIHTQWPPVAIVILTTYDEDDLMIRGFRTGALGYFLKYTNRQTLFDSLRAAARGEALLLPEIMARVLLISDGSSRKMKETSLDGISLTDREEEVLIGVTRGQRNKEIAFRLRISERTVKAHLTNIFNKLGVDTRAAAVSVAHQQGLISLDSELL